MNDFPETEWMDLARALDAIIVRMKEASFTDLCEAFRNVQRRFIAQLVDQGTSEDTVYVQRAVAGAIFSTAIGKRLPPAECESCLNDLATIGFQDFHHECTSWLMFCRHLVRLGNIQKARCYLDALEEKHKSQGCPFDWVTTVIAELRNNDNFRGRC